MKKYILAAAVLGLAACNNAESIADSNEKLVAAEIYAGIGTRASGTTWDAGDQIGVTATSSGLTTGDAFTNIPYTADNAGACTSTTPINFQDDKEVTFSAYYPYSSNGKTEITNVDTRPSAQANQKSFDFMFATGAKAQKDNPQVLFTGANAFKHVMSQISFEFVEGTDITLNATSFPTITLQNVSWIGKFMTQTGVTTLDGQSKISDENCSTVFPLNASSSDVKCTVGPLILFPQSFTTAAMTLVAIVDGENYTATLKNKDESLEAGKSYVFKIKINKTGMEQITADIQPWGSGTVSDEYIAR